MRELYEMCYRKFGYELKISVCDEISYYIIVVVNNEV